MMLCFVDKIEIRLLGLETADAKVLQPVVRSEGASEDGVGSDDDFSVGITGSTHTAVCNEEEGGVVAFRIGEVTSGGFSPCLKKNTAKPGTEVKSVVICGKSNDGVVVAKMPVVPS
ncbi:hypothetical protein B296_00008122, partial [Ensete ventricosum]